MGLFDLLTSTKHPAPGVKKLSEQELRAALMSLNRPSAPYILIDGQAEDVDLIAEWQTNDVERKEVLTKERLSTVFKIYLKFNPRKYEVRALDKQHTVTWKSGVTELSTSREYFRGQKYTFGTGDFVAREMKKQIQDAVTQCGWIYKGIIFGRL